MSLVDEIQVRNKVKSKKKKHVKYEAFIFFFFVLMSGDIAQHLLLKKNFFKRIEECSKPKVLLLHIHAVFKKLKLNDNCKMFQSIDRKKKKWLSNARAHRCQLLESFFFVLKLTLSDV